MVRLTVDWDLLPDELLLRIFGFFSDIEIELYSRVCKRWRILSRDRTLRWALCKVKNGIPPEYVFLECCLRGDVSSMDPLLDILTRPGRIPSEGHLVLWNHGFLEAVKGGHVHIAQKMLSFGAVPYFETALLECCYRHVGMVKFLLEEQKFRWETLKTAKTKALEHERDDIALLLTKYLS